DLAAGVVLEAGRERSRGRGDLRDVLGRGAADRGELATDVGVGAVAAVERDRVHGAVDDGRPRGDRVGRGGAEAEHVVPGVRRATLGDRGETADGVHVLAALHD